MNNENTKEWTRDVQGYEDAWSHHGGGTFTLGGQSTNSLPSNVYTISVSAHGELLYNAVSVNTDKLIVMDNSATDKIFKTITRFWESKDLYKQFGQIYKRGILLYGVQGAGKSSALDLLFNDVLKRGGLVFIVDDPYLAVKAVERLRLLEPERNLILLYEDIDSLFQKHGESNLLSMLDGQLQFNSVLHLATTNYIESIPPRLKNRPGRFDEVIEIQPPSTDERKLFIEHLMTPIEDKSKILEMIVDTDGFSLSHIKELILSVHLLGKDYKETLNRLQEMKNV